MNSPQITPTPPPAATTPKNPASHWLALAGAGGAGLVAAAGNADAAIVQIDLIGNQITSAGNWLNPDMTGDGAGDVMFLYPAYQGSLVQLWVDVLGGLYNAFAYNFGSGFRAYVAGNYQAGNYALSVEGLIQVSFTDTAINGGALTNGWLDLHAFNSSATSHTVQLTRLVFDDASTTAPTGVVAGGSNTSIGQTENGVFTAVPEPSSLALLALGAGGLLVRRRRKAAAAA